VVPAIALDLLEDVEVGEVVEELVDEVAVEVGIEVVSGELVLEIVEDAGAFEGRLIGGLRVLACSQQEVLAGIGDHGCGDAVLVAAGGDLETLLKQR
jgi:hypothetical protein